MANQTNGSHFSREAGADLSAKQYYLVKINSSNKAVLAAAATDVIAGVLENAPASGETADIRARNGCGTGKVVAGGNITHMAALTSDANGKAVVTTTAGNHVIGYALSTGVDGQVIEYIKANHKY